MSTCFKSDDFFFFFNQKSNHEWTLSSPSRELLSNTSNLHMSLQQRSLPLFLSPNFDLRAHVESLGHGVTGCTDLRMTPRRCAGFLTKRGGRVKTWKKRWFLFDMDHRRLAYYTGQTGWRGSVCTMTTCLHKRKPARDTFRYYHNSNAAFQLPPSVCVNLLLSITSVSTKTVKE